jgi:3-dehydroquinate synthase
MREGRLRFVVLKALGEAATMGNIDRALAEAAFLETGATR